MAARGGRREGAGRNQNDPPCIRVGLYITEAQVKLLRMWGRGNASDGLRWLMDLVAPMVRKAEKSEK